MQFPDPTNVSLSDWANNVAYVCAQYDNIGPLIGEDWQAWGMSFYNNQQLGVIHPPNPYDYQTWQEWGYRLAETMINARGSQRKN